MSDNTSTAFETAVAKGRNLFAELGRRLESASVQDAACEYFKKYYIGEADENDPGIDGVLAGEFRA
jgi:hypothetical protein